jgi:hypothetical protein
MPLFNWVPFNNVAKAIYLCLLIIVLTVIISAFALTTMYRMSSRLYKPIEKSNILREKFFLGDTSQKNIGYPKMQYLKMQYAVLSFFKEHHKELGRVYYSNYYSFNVVLTIATIILAILVFLIANKGWQTSDIFLKISFCTVFFISSFLGIMTITLGQKENYESNFKQYLYYDKIQTNIITFVNTTDQYKPSRIANLTDSFIVAISSDLRANGQFFMAIDANKISFDDISGKLGKSLNGKP